MKNHPATRESLVEKIGNETGALRPDFRDCYAALFTNATRTAPISGCRIFPPKFAVQIIRISTTNASASNALANLAGTSAVLRNFTSANRQRAPSSSRLQNAKSAALEC